MPTLKCTLSPKILAVWTQVYLGICLCLTKASVENNVYQGACTQTDFTEALNKFLDSIAFNKKEDCVRVMCAPKYQKYQRNSQMMTPLEPYAKTNLGNSALSSGYGSSTSGNSAMPRGYVSSTLGNSAMPSGYDESLTTGNSAMPRGYGSSTSGNSAIPGGYVSSASKTFNEITSVMHGRWYVITDPRGNPIGVSTQEDVQGKYAGFYAPPSLGPSKSQYNQNYINPPKPAVVDSNVCCSTVESYFINETMKDITGATRTLAQIQHTGSYQIIRHGFCGKQGVCPGVCEQVYVVMPLAIVPNDLGQIVTYRYFNIPGYCSCKVPANMF